MSVTESLIKLTKKKNELKMHIKISESIYFFKTSAINDYLLLFLSSIYYISATMLKNPKVLSHIRSHSLSFKNCKSLLSQQFFIKYPAVNIKRSSGLPCLILYAHFQIFKSVLGCYIWISSSISLSQTTGTIYIIRTLKKDDFIKYSLILNIHPSYPPPKYCGHQNPIPRCLFGTIITGSEVNRIYCVNFACS